MTLDDHKAFTELDPENMLAEIDGLPDQLSRAWEVGQQLSLPAVKHPGAVLIVGMGGSAIGADLLAAYIAPNCSVPVLVHRDYGLPAWARGEETLVIASSFGKHGGDPLGI